MELLKCVLVQCVLERDMSVLRRVFKCVLVHICSESVCYIGLNQFVHLHLCSVSVCYIGV